MFKRICFRFTRTASIIDLRTTAMQQLRFIKRKARSYEVINRTNRQPASFI